MVKILVLEDDAELNVSLCKHLTLRGYGAAGCLSADAAYDRLYSEKFDLIISDIMMPKVDGFEFAENVRLTDKYIPIIFLTARDDFSSKQRGFALGIDDYMTKPINIDELMLHIEAILRRARIAAEKKLVIGSLVLDEEEYTATVDGTEVTLTLREFQILYKLLSYPKKTFTRSQLTEDFAGFESESGLRAVDVHITNLRAKFADCKDFKIETVRGLGYKAVIL